MNKVYVVTSGSYSDYKIEGVFTSKLKANAFVNDAWAQGYNEIEIYDLNLLLKPKDNLITLLLDSNFNFHSAEYDNNAVLGIKNTFFYGKSIGYLITIKDPKDKQKALKIAADKLTEYLSNKGVISK